MRAKKWSEMSSETTPIERVRFEIRPRAIGLGTNARSRIADSTRSLVASVTRGLSLITRDTVWWDTPAWAATSRIVGGRPELPLTAPLTAAYVTSHTARVTDHKWRGSASIADGAFASGTSPAGSGSPAWTTWIGDP